MSPSLLLLLALLGTASCSHPAPASPEVLETSLEVPGNDTRQELVPDPRGVPNTRYIVVPRPLSFRRAMRVCARRFGGRLASIHSAGTNAALQLQARLNTKSGFVWIGAVTKPWRRTVQCHWVDRSPWDFHNWQLRHPLCTGRFCTTLCTADGRWRSQGCKVKLPFICEC